MSDDRVVLDEWFLAANERGNPDTQIDFRHDGVAWTEGNRVDVLIDGEEYYAALHDELTSIGPGDSVAFTGLEGNADERLLGTESSEVGRVLCEAVERGAEVRGLVWRSHALIYSQGENLLFTRRINEVGGEVFLDHRVRRGGSHHQKMVIVRRGVDADRRDVAYVGGMDLAHGRHDGQFHGGDPQPADLSESNYGPTPPWHDVQARICGPAVDDVAYTFRERWEDPTPLDTHNPLRAVQHRFAKQSPIVTATELPPERDTPEPCGTCAVQVLRTYPWRNKQYPFARQGERSIARAYIKSFRRARRLIYLEDQYLWSFSAADELCAALRREPDLLLVIVIPRYPDPDGAIAGTASALGRERVQDALYEAGGDRVAIYDVENQAGTSVYVHSKVCVVDDIWMAVGSDNLNRRSWTHDSEVSCAVIDSRLDEREPRDITGAGDHPRHLARDTRVRLACEHIGLSDDEADVVVDPKAWFDEIRIRADALDGWHASGQVGARPPGHLRRHRRERVTQTRRRLLHWMHAHVLDPDGRPSELKRRDAY